MEEVFMQISLDRIYEIAKKFRENKKLLLKYKNRFKEKAENYQEQLKARDGMEKERIEANEYKIKLILEELSWLEKKKNL